MCIRDNVGRPLRLGLGMAARGHGPRGSIGQAAGEGAVIDAKLRVAGFARAHRRPIAMTLVTVIALGAAALWWSLPASVDTYTATREDLVQSVVVTGQVISPQRAVISSEFAARVARVLADEGATVTRGQPL